MNKKRPYFQYYFTLLLCLVFLGITEISAQKQIASDTIPFTRFSQVSVKFTKPTLELKKGIIISNVLKVVNNNTKEISFTVDALFPAGWSRIDDESRKYLVKPKDTAIVPIIISPTKLVNGNTEIIINTFVINSENQQIANSYFTVTTKKKLAWSLNLENNTNYYFKNNEDSKDFSFSLTNSGNFKQDIAISYLIPREDLTILDTLDNPIDQTKNTFSLVPSSEKFIHLRAKITNEDKRNNKRISINNYIPNENKDRVTRSLIINSSEPKIEKDQLRRRTKVNFVKLPNELETSPYGYPNLPLIVDVTAQNVLDDRTFLSLTLQGFKQLNQDASLAYFTQFNYSNSFFTNNVFKNAPWYVGYFDSKKTIEIGQISGDIIGIAAAGKGIKASYRLTDQHSFGAFYTNSTGLFDAANTIVSYGAWYKLKYNENVRLVAKAGRSNNRFINQTTNIATVQPSVRFLKNHSVNFLGGYSNRKTETNGNEISKNGFIIGSGYTSSLLKRKLKSVISFRYNDRNFSNGTSERLFLNQRVSYDISKDWTSIFSGNYQNVNIYNRNTDRFIYQQETLFANLLFSTKTEEGSYQPGLYYEYRNFPNNAFINRGVNFRYSIFKFAENLLSSIFTRAGYAREINVDDAEEYFSLEVSALFRYKTLNFTSRYNLGTFSTITSQQNAGDGFKTPQSIRSSIQHQYLFPNRKLMLESSLIHSFNNIFNNHTLGIFPQLFYYTNSGWRFGFSANYIFTTSDFSSVFDATDVINNPNLQNVGPTTTSNLNLNFNLRKEFGVPIPFTKQKSATKKFVAFLDINGNGIKEKNEISIQNVVIKLNKNEVITNVDGEATIKNLEADKYKLETMSLENLNGWFANTQDSIFVEQDGIEYIPFVRGIKVYGDVIVDRQKIAITEEKPLDLSLIKVTAVKGDKVYNTLTDSDGRFEFYLPFGQYTITMDESILGDRFNVTRNNLPVLLKNNQDGVYISYYIVEKRRKVIFKDFTKKKNE